MLVSAELDTKPSPPKTSSSQSGQAQEGITRTPAVGSVPKPDQRLRYPEKGTDSCGGVDPFYMVTFRGLSFDAVDSPIPKSFLNRLDLDRLEQVPVNPFAYIITKTN